MNTKRQTIWLVSMLSLMVILSAYYLFTEDAAPQDLTDAKGITDVVLGDGATEATSSEMPGLTEEIIVTEDEHIGGKDSAEPTSEADKEVLSILKEQQAVSSDYFTQQQFLRAEQLSSEVSEAIEQLDSIQEVDEKISGLEEELGSEFNKVAITPEADKYKVVVQSENLERAQAAGILDTVMRALDVSPERVTVQFVQ
jgi:stage III sporulation protein AH